MIKEPSLLWKRLGARAPMFEIYSPVHGLLNDDDLMSVTVSRGNASSPAGLAVSTMTADVRGALARCPSHLSLVRFRLTQHGLDRLAALTGTGAAAVNLQKRFEGKIATQRVTDEGDGERPRWRSQMQCGEWLSLLSTIDRGATITRQRPEQKWLIDSLIRRSTLPPAQTETPIAWLGNTWHRRYFAPTDPDVLTLTTADVLDTWGEKAGTLIRTTRSGQVQALTLDYRETQGTTWRTTAPQPLLRSQCLAPTSWVQDPTVPHSVRWTDRSPANPTTLVTHTISVGKLGDVDAYPTETIDMTTVIPAGADELNAAMTARVSRSAPDRYQVERLTVDLLHLLTSDRAIDRAQARQLLLAEIGDPITLAYDWPGDVDGVKFITQMSETVTPTSWRIELDLLPWNRVIGKPEPSPAGTTWHTAYPRGTTWNTVPSKPWNEAP